MAEPISVTAAEQQPEVYEIDALESIQRGLAEATSGQSSRMDWITNGVNLDEEDE